MNPEEPSPERTGFSRRSKLRGGGFFARDAREILWDGMDFLEQRPKLRLRLYVGIPLAALAIAAAFWGHSMWSRAHAIRIGRQWLAAGKLDRAMISAKGALSAAPDAPDAWAFAAAVEWRLGDKALATEDLKKASELSRNKPDAVIAWAEAAVLAGDTDSARKALDMLPPGFLEHSARAERAMGEWFRRTGAYREAVARFEAALKLDRQASAASSQSTRFPWAHPPLHKRRRGSQAGRGAAHPRIGRPRAGRRPPGSSSPTRFTSTTARRSPLDPILSKNPRVTMGYLRLPPGRHWNPDPQAFQGLLKDLKAASGKNPIAWPR